MITKREKTKIKKILGGHYTDAVLEELHKRGVRNRNGMPHSATMVQNVMNGQAHAEIEAAIYKAVETATLKEQQERERRNLILEQTKTGAATPA